MSTNTDRTALAALAHELWFASMPALGDCSDEALHRIVAILERPQANTAGGAFFPKASAFAQLQPSTPAPDVSLSARIDELIEQHGSLRAAARELDCDPGYLSRLASGEKTDPGTTLLLRMGLRSTTTYQRMKS